MKKVTLNPKRDYTVVHHHPWIFSGAVRSVDGNPAPGETVFSLCQNETSPVIVIGEGFSLVREELEAGAPAIFIKENGYEC